MLFIHEIHSLDVPDTLTLEFMYENGSIVSTNFLALIGFSWREAPIFGWCKWADLGKKRTSSMSHPRQRRQLRLGIVARSVTCSRSFTWRFRPVSAAETVASRPAGKDPPTVR